MVFVLFSRLQISSFTLYWSYSNESNCTLSPFCSHFFSTARVQRCIGMPSHNTTLDWFRSFVAITTSFGTIIVELCTSLIVHSELKKLTWNLCQENYLHYVIIIAIFFNLFIVRVKRKYPLNTSLWWNKLLQYPWFRNSRCTSGNPLLGPYELKYYLHIGQWYVITSNSESVFGHKQLTKEYKH